MSRLYIRLMTGFYSHRKTARLRAALGDDAYWIPPRLWAYCAENQPDGDLSGYEAAELAMLVGYVKDASSMLVALKSCGFITDEGHIHDWNEHNGYHKKYSERAKIAAAARWKKAPPHTPPKEDKERGNRKGESGDKHCLEHACSMEDDLVSQICSWFKRRPTTVWSDREKKALKTLGQVDPEDLTLLAAYYTGPSKIKRRDILTLLNNWNGEVDRARDYQRAPHEYTNIGNGSHRNGAAQSPAPDHSKGF